MSDRVITYAVIDCETTGFDPKTEQVVEIGMVELVYTGPYRTFTQSREQLVKPTIPIPPQASAVHHITDDDVRYASRIEDAAKNFTFMEGAVDCYYVAHHSRFDQSFLTPELGFKHPWLDTYRIAQRLYLEAPSYGNQTLRYWLSANHNIPRDIGLPHRALPDAVVTAGLFELFLTLASIEDMRLWSNQPALLRTINFGKHAGLAWSEAPKDYLSWVLRAKDFDDDTVFTAQYWYDRK